MSGLFQSVATEQTSGPMSNTDKAALDALLAEGITGLSTVAGYADTVSGAVGTSTRVARADHSHPFPGGFIATTGGNLTGALNEAPMVTLPSASIVNIGAASSNNITITGTTTITGFDSITAGATRILTFTGAVLLTYNATSMILTSGANMLTAVNDTAEFISLGSGNWKCLRYTFANTSVSGLFTEAVIVPTSNGQTTLVPIGGYGIGAIDVFKDGEMLYGNGVNYTASDGVNIVLNVGANTTDTFLIRKWTVATITNAITTAGGTLLGALNQAAPVTIPSSPTVAISTANANAIYITGTSTINGFDTITAGATRTLIFTGSLQLTYNSTSLQLPGNTNIITTPGDACTFMSLGSGNWKCIQYVPSNAVVSPSSQFTINTVTPSTGGQTTFTVPGGYSVGALDVYQNGIMLFPTIDYTATNGTTVVLLNASVITDSILFRAWTTVGLSNVLDLSGGTMTGAINETAILTLASASTVAIGAAAANTINITGSTTITGFDSMAVSGAKRTLNFMSNVQLTYNSVSMILPGFTNINAQAGDTAEFVNLGGSNWKCINYKSYTLPSALSNTVTCLYLLNQ